MAFYKILILFLTLLPSSILVSQEYEHPNNLYNKALTYYHNNDLGNAMYYTKEALILTPYKNEIRTLFYQIRKDIGLPQIYSSDTIGGEIFSYLFGRIPPQINSLLGACLFVLGSLLVMGMILKMITASYQKITTIGIWIFFIGAGILFTQALVQYYIFFKPNQGVLITESSAYEEPYNDSFKVLDLPAGTEVSIIDTVEEFYLVKTLDGKEYWVITQNVPLLFQNNNNTPS